MNPFENIDVPKLPDFTSGNDADVDMAYFERHRGSPTLRETIAPPESEHSAEKEKVEPEPKRIEEQKPRRLSNVRVKYQYKFKHATVPKTPNLRSLARTRQLCVDTPNTQAAKELESMKKNQFKAIKLDKRIFSAPFRPKLSHKHTEPNEPHLLTKDRAALSSRENIKSDDENENQFHAQPLPDYEELRRLGVYNHNMPQATVPKSPAFSLIRTRSMKDTPNDEDKPASYYHPPPKFGTPFRPKRSNKVTKIASFSFENRVLSNKYTKGHNSETSEGDNESNTFRAQPVPKIIEKPFQPRRNLIPPTKPRESLVPHSVSRRLEKRQEFDREFASRSESVEKRRQERLAKEQEEAKKLLRSKTEFQSHPVKHFKPVQIRLEHKATNAASPKFSQRLNCVDKRKLESLKK